MSTVTAGPYLNKLKQDKTQLKEEEVGMKFYPNQAIFNWELLEEGKSAFPSEMTLGISTTFHAMPLAQEELPTKIRLHFFPLFWFYF